MKTDSSRTVRKPSELDLKLCFTRDGLVSSVTREDPGRRQWGNWVETLGCIRSDTCQCKVWPPSTPEFDKKTFSKIFSFYLTNVEFFFFLLHEISIGYIEIFGFDSTKMT